MNEYQDTMLEFRTPRRSTATKYIQALYGLYTEYNNTHMGGEWDGLSSRLDIGVCITPLEDMSEFSSNFQRGQTFWSTDHGMGIGVN